MSLIDSEAEKLAKMRTEADQKSAAKPENSAGLGRRFGSLNKAKRQVDEFRKKVSASVPSPAAIEKKPLPVEQFGIAVEQSVPENKASAETPYKHPTEKHHTNAIQIPYSKESSKTASEVAGVNSETPYKHHTDSENTIQTPNKYHTNEDGEKHHTNTIQDVEGVETNDDLKSALGEGVMEIPYKHHTEKYHTNTQQTPYKANLKEQNSASIDQNQTELKDEGTVASSSVNTIQIPNKDHTNTIQTEKTNGGLNLKEDRETPNKHHTRSLHRGTESLETDKGKDTTREAIEPTGWNLNTDSSFKTKDSAEKEIGPSSTATSPISRAPEDLRQDGATNRLSLFQKELADLIIDEPSNKTPLTTDSREKHEATQHEPSPNASLKEARTNTIQTPYKDPTATPNKGPTNTKQTPHNHPTNAEQTPYKPRTIAQQTPHKYHTEYHTESSPGLHISSLVGQEKLFVELVFQSCKENASLYSRQLSSVDVGLALNLPIEDKITLGKHVATVSSRIVKKGYFHKRESKTGRGGWTVYELPRQVYDQLILDEQTPYKHPTKHSKNGSIDISIIKNNINNNREITETLLVPPTPTVGEIYPNIDLTPVKDFHITKKHIYDIKKNKWDLDESTLQELINKFPVYASDPEMKKANRGSLASVFLGIVKCKAKEGECVLDFIGSDIDREHEIQMAELAAKKAQKEERERQRIDAEFSLWRVDGVTPAIRAQIPDVIRDMPDKIEHWLKNYFIEKVLKSTPT